MEHNNVSAFHVINMLPQWGVTEVVICPGSRSAPLALLAANHPLLSFDVRVDERSAAYIALGKAIASKRAVALICTSGTAAVNFYPAITEAFYQQIPLVIITADRPPHLIDRLDGQAIRQKGLFSLHTVFEFDTGLCTSDDLLSLLNQNLIQAGSIIEQFLGPIHINVPLIEPLYVLPKFDFTLTQISKHAATTNQSTLPSKLQASLAKYKNVLFLVGMQPPDVQTINASFPESIFLSASEFLGNTPTNIQQLDLLLGTLNKEMLEQLRPELLITSGLGWVSKRVKQWLRANKPIEHWHVAANGIEQDPFFALTSCWQVDFSHAWFLLNDYFANNYKGFLPYKSRFLEANKRVASVLPESLSDSMSEINLMPWLRENMHKAHIHLANSSSVRLGMLWGFKNSLRYWSNRGTSGIDGCTSTAVGAALTLQTEQHVLITGDLAFLYDQHAFWGEIPANLKIIVFNNGGGGIFGLIDGPFQQSKFNELFFTPHHLSIRQVAKLYGVRHFFADNVDEFKKQFLLWRVQNTCAILEIKTDIESNRTAWKAFFQKLSSI